ncbi:MAG: FecR domain-containing protein [Alphaproteobacteria bacterium]|nr:MAG: FecR domain-containing protein [Alphaproteobacteria bacterium]
MPGKCDRETPGKRRPPGIPLVGMLAVMAVCAVFNPAQVEAQQPAGTARIVVNNVTSTRPTSPERIVLHVGSNVIQNEVIDTAANSATLIVFPDNSQLAICPSAEVVLRSFELGPKPTLAVFIPIGCTRFSSGLLLKTASINTPSAEIRPYGTILTVTVSARGGTTVSVADGSASVTGAGRTVSVGTGQSTLVMRGQPPTPPVPTPPAPPIVTEMNALLVAAAAQDFGTRAAARSPPSEAPHGANMYSLNIDGKIQSEIAGDATPAFGCAGSTGSLGSRGTHGACASR